MNRSLTEILLIIFLSVIVSIAAYGQADTSKIRSLMNEANVNSGKDLKKSTELIKEAYNLCSKTTEKKLKAECLNEYGWIEFLNGNYPGSLNVLIEGLKLAQEVGDRKLQADIMRNISASYHFQGPENFPSAISYAKKSLQLFLELKDKPGIAAGYQELGGLYCDNISKPTFNLKLAEDYFQKALDLQLEMGNKVSAASLESSLSYIYACNEDYTKALECIERSRVIFEEVKDNQGIMYSHYGLADINYRMGNIPIAIDHVNKCIEMASEYGNKDLLNNAYEMLSGYHSESGDYKTALEDYHKSVALKFELYNEERIKSFTNLEKKYESEKKQKEIELLNKDSELQKTEIDRQTTQKYAFIGGFVLMLLLSVVIFKSYRDKKKANTILALQKHEIEEKNEELKQQNDEILAQRDEISAQRDLVTKQRDHINEQKKGITDSITYAKRIQNAMLPDLNRVLGLQSSVDSRQLAIDSRQSDPQIADCRLPNADYFILYKPKDIVSGDFYWATRINEWLILTVADCTGHGVPGAFMSMLGVSFLNEIVRKKEITKASEVLDHLRSSIIDALQQKEQTGEALASMKNVQDGMDISLCALNTSTNVLQFAGANNPLFIVTARNELKIIPADKQPVAIYINMKPFTNQEIQLQKGDSIYLASDGYQDQFGGPDKKKFLVKKLRELLMKIKDKTMAEQKEIIDKTFEDWKGDYSQVDDVTIMGLKI